MRDTPKAHAEPSKLTTYNCWIKKENLVWLIFHEEQRKEIHFIGAQSTSIGDNV